MRACTSEELNAFEESRQEFNRHKAAAVRDHSYGLRTALTTCVDPNAEVARRLRLPWAGRARSVSEIERYDVAIIGAGIAGVAASIFLRQAGRSVVCLDARPYPHHQVGESLDWSSPGLLRRVGLLMIS